MQVNSPYSFFLPVLILDFIFLKSVLIFFKNKVKYQKFNFSNFIYILMIMSIIYYAYTINIAYVSSEVCE